MAACLRMLRARPRRGEGLAKPSWLDIQVVMPSQLLGPRETLLGAREFAGDQESERSDPEPYDAMVATEGGAESRCEPEHTTNK